MTRPPSKPAGISDRLRWLHGARPGPVELWPILLLGGAAAAVWAFLALADEVGEGDTRALDEHLLLALRTSGDLSDPLGPAWLEEVGRDFTALGGTGVMVFLVVAVTCFLVLARRRAEAGILVVATLGALGLQLLLKAWFDRPRPDLVPHASYVFNASFPSGHATMSAVVFLTIGALLASSQPEPRIRIYIASLAVLLTLLVGVSRVYLGVHWPTDVLAGWALGAAWAAICWAAAIRLRRTGT